jgi:hypothetical protein
MIHQHQSREPWEWTLALSSALRVPVAGRTRWLLVTAGRAWLTRTGAGVEGGDVWLAAGERHALPAGSEWVVEGWPQARLALLEAPARRTGADLSAVLRRAWPRRWPGLRAA